MIINAETWTGVCYRITKQWLNESVWNLVEYGTNINPDLELQKVDIYFYFIFSQRKDYKYYIFQSNSIVKKLRNNT